MSGLLTFLFLGGPLQCMDVLKRSVLDALRFANEGTCLSLSQPLSKSETGFPKSEMRSGRLEVLVDLAETRQRIFVFGFEKFVYRV